MLDGQGRALTYLRVSVTDRCNLRCRYCMPETGIESIPHAEVLRYEEILRLVAILARLGVRRVRLTGGEPLVRKGVAGLARGIKRVPGIETLGITTNGALLPVYAEELRRAGVDGVNISIDSLDPARYARITRIGRLEDALSGLRAALATGFPSVKVNCVLEPGGELRDWLSIAALARAYPVDVRFIEWMPMAGEKIEGEARGEDLRAALEAAYGSLAERPGPEGGGPARVYEIEGFRGRVGFIEAMSHGFCGSCNRLRLTARGDLKLCLFSDAGVSLRPLLRGGADDAAIAAAICEAVQGKPKAHTGAVTMGESGGIAHSLGMYQTGG